MNEQAALFRSDAVAYAADETLFDESVRLIRPRLRIAILTLLALLVAAIAWSAVFFVPISVPGRGILLSPGGLADVVVNASGQIRVLTVKPGDSIAVGQTVAWLEQPDLRQKLAIATGELAEYDRIRRNVGTLQSHDSAARGSFRASRVLSLDQRIAALGEQRAALATRVSGMEGLAARGLVSRERLAEVRLSLVNMDGQIADSRDERVKMAADAEATLSGDRREMLEADRRVLDAERNVHALREQLTRTGAVRSPFAGRVVEVKANVGQSVADGTPLLTLERAADGPAGAHARGAGLSAAVIYVSAVDGKKLRPGMAAAISPASTRQQEDGEIVGRIVHVSDVPASSAGMLHRLQNDQLVQVFAQSGAPFEVEVALDPDPVHPGQPRWTTGRQPAAAIDSGTLADARFTVRRERLLAFAIPALAHGGDAR